MEFSEKLAQLRKSKGLTQEQLADELHVSRTAISKWENGRGIPSIDSLQLIARFFEITVDDLLSADAVLDVALSEKRSLSRTHLQLVSAWLSIAALACALLPLYKSQVDGMFASVPLYQLDSPLMLIFAALQLLMTACGIAALLAIKSAKNSATNIQLIAGDALCVLLAAAFALTMQPYPACTFIAILVAKTALRVKFSQLKA